MHNLPPMLTPAQTCEFLQISRSALDRRIDNGTVPYVKLPGGKSSPIRIPRDALPESLGMIEPAPKRRRSREVSAELNRAAALFGVEFKDDQPQRAAS